MWAQHNINVNCILPGLIATEELKGYGIIPANTDAEGNPVPRLELTPNPEDVADLALFLASPGLRCANRRALSNSRLAEIRAIWQ